MRTFTTRKFEMRNFMELDNVTRTITRFIVAVSALVASTLPLHAQERHTVDGQVVRPYTLPKNSAPAAKDDSVLLANVPNVMVTLHRVGKDEQGPLDSVRTNAEGKYHFVFKPSGSSDAIYFTSVTYGGIAYFTAPLKNAVNNGRDAEITVFDTTSRQFPLTISGRHLIVSAADTNSERTVVEVFEISNDSTLTLVSGSKKSGQPTFSVKLPPDARKFKAGEGGEVSPDAYVFQNGRVNVYAPFAPGIKQLTFSYKLPSKSFPITFAVEHGAVVIEILLEEALGNATGAKLAATDAVSLENRNFRRFLAQDVPDGAEITISLPSGPSVGRNLYIATLLGTIGVVMLLILLRAMQRRRPLTYGAPIMTPVRAPEVPLADKLAREIADLDSTYARQDNPSEALRTAYEERRAELKDALAAELARK